MTTAGERDRPLMQCTSTRPPLRLTSSAGAAAARRAGSAHKSAHDRVQLCRRCHRVQHGKHGRQQPQQPGRHARMRARAARSESSTGATAKARTATAKERTKEVGALLQRRRRLGDGVVREGVLVQRLAAGHRLRAGGQRRWGVGWVCGPSTHARRRCQPAACALPRPPGSLAHTFRMKPMPRVLRISCREAWSYDPRNRKPGSTSEGNAEGGLGGGDGAAAPPCAGATSSRCPHTAQGSPPWYCTGAGREAGPGDESMARFWRVRRSTATNPRPALAGAAALAGSCLPHSRHGSARTRRRAPRARASASWRPAAAGSELLRPLVEGVGRRRRCLLPANSCRGVA